MSLGSLIHVLTLAATWIWYKAYSIDHAQGGAWGCEMSWMTPSYEKVPVPGSTIARYNLYLYREQGWDGHIQNGSAPIIFVPGNAGSYQQVRSIASAVSRQYHGQPGSTAHDMIGIDKPDIYTIDLNEDFSALHGGLLRDQAKYLVACISEVREIHGVGQVTLVAHSMGGIVARLAAQMMPPGTVDVIITLSTPHILPPVALDIDMDRVYQEISLPGPTPLISVCGGSSDTQIASDACAIELDHDQGFSVFTSAMPGVWTGVDHQAMVWCHQLRWQVARTLLEIRRVREPSAKLQRAKRLLVFGNDEVLTPIPTDNVVTVRGPTTVIIGHESRGAPICQGGHCSERDLQIEAIPLPAPTLPFPFPGEGIKQHEIGTAISLNSTKEVNVSLPVGTKYVSGPHAAMVVEGRVWANDGPPPTRVTLTFSQLSTSSLKAYRLIPSFGACTGRPPLIRHQTVPSDPLFESRFFPSNAPDIIIHSHIGTAPYISRQHKVLVVDIYQWPGCSVEQIVLQEDFWRTYAKAVPRFRSAAMAWTTGWISIITRSSLDCIDIRDHEYRVRPIIATLLVLLGLTLLQPWLPMRVGLLLGSEDRAVIHMMLLLALSTLLVAISIKKILLSWRSMILPKSQAEIRPYSSIQIAGLLGLVVLCSFVVPQGLIDLVLVGILVAKCNRANTSPSWPWMLTACVVLLPADIAPLAAWSRAILANRFGVPQIDHNPLSTVPVLGLIYLAGNEPALQRKRLLWLVKMVWSIVSLICFLIGPRHTYVVQYSVRIAIASTCMLSW